MYFTMELPICTGEQAVYIQEPINIIIFLTRVHFNITIYNNQSHLKAYHAYFYKKKYVMDENDPLSE